MGGWLATIDQESTFDGIRNAVIDEGMDNEDCHNYGFWIGYYDATPDGDGHTALDFEWLHGMCTNWTEWQRNQPDDNTKMSAVGQNCVQMWFRKKGRFDDEYCTKLKGYVCQVPESCDCKMRDEDD
ncbi:C-type lectin domain family 19 member A-like [Saccoglossus kowalevskii]|uniref:Hepatic lectin-like n=1 Tax=Saccoglossus kowalevskii TaxID=10224 RepID=A0ABM0GTN7_SACKO|nr:PREDICTED: hepatic lectin-like [Saccoglossus kowalevskii]